MQGMTDRPFVLYVADAYCGWCFGFGPRLKAFAAANRDRVDFRVISGGLFVGERVRPIGQFAHIAEANAQIARQTGVEFGAAYTALVQQGTFTMDSAAAGAGLAALRSQDESRGVEFFERMQDAFYVEGRSLSDPETYASIAGDCGLDPKLTAHMLASGEAGELAKRDFAIARKLGVSSYPTLLVVEGWGGRRLAARGAPLDVLNGELAAALAG
jgi:putative protein-disulfide isomerase